MILWPTAANPGEEGQRIGKTLLEHTWVDNWYKSTLTFTLTDDAFISGTYKHGHGTISGSLKVAVLGHRAIFHTKHTKRRPIANEIY